MKNTLPWLILSAILAIASVSITQAESQDEHAEAAALWPQIAAFNEWKLVPRTSTMMPGQAPHGKYVSIHANNRALATLPSSAITMPAGATYAKANYSSTRELESITVMHRKPDGWLWITYAPDGFVREAGSLQSCIACHSGAERDMVFTWEQPRR